MNNDQVSVPRSNRKGHRFVRRFAAAAVVSVGVLGVSNIESASAATPCASVFDLCYPMSTTGPVANQAALYPTAPAQTIGLGWWSGATLINATNQAAMYAAQQNDIVQAQTFSNQLSAQNAAQAAPNWQIMQTSQTNMFSYTQNVTAMAALRANSAFDLMAAYIR